IAHVSQKHCTRRYADSKRISRNMMAGILASLALAIAGEAEAGMAGVMSAQAAAIQAQLTYSRHHEREADRVGMQILLDAGLDPQAMPTFFERLLKTQQFSGKPPEFILTHPVTETRVADSKSRARALPRGPRRDALEFELIRNRLQALYIADPQNAIRHFQRVYNKGSSAEQQALGFGLAMAAMRAKKYDVAQETLALLQQQAPNQIWYQLAAAENLERQRQYQEAADTAAKVLRLSPGHYGASIIYARNLISINELHNARQVLERLQWQHDTVEIKRLVAKIWTEKKGKARSHLAHGELLFALGDDEGGIQQLHYALQHSKGNFALYSQVKARLDTMQQLAEIGRAS